MVVTKFTLHCCLLLEKFNAHKMIASVIAVVILTPMININMK